VRNALRLRRELWFGRSAVITWLDAADGCLAFRRADSGPTCLVNLTDGAQPWSTYGDEVVLSSAASDVGDHVAPHTTVWVV
jgi:alpha-glucosidase